VHPTLPYAPSVPWDGDLNLERLATIDDGEELSRQLLAALGAAGDREPATPRPSCCSSGSPGRASCPGRSWRSCLRVPTLGSGHRQVIAAIEDARRLDAADLDGLAERFSLTTT
jgi:hypothetical protein